jgi:hypothetical protein
MDSQLGFSIGVTVVIGGAKPHVIIVKGEALEVARGLLLNYWGLLWGRLCIFGYIGSGEATVAKPPGLCCESWG